MQVSTKTPREVALPTTQKNAPRIEYHSLHRRPMTRHAASHINATQRTATQKQKPETLNTKAMLTAVNTGRAGKAPAATLIGGLLNRRKPSNEADVPFSKAKPNASPSCHDRQVVLVSFWVLEHVSHQGVEGDIPARNQVQRDKRAPVTLAHVDEYPFDISTSGSRRTVPPI